MSAAYIAANFASTTLAGTLATGATSATLTNGAAFPAPTNGDYTLLTLKNSTGGREIICVVGRSGNSITIGIPGSDLPNASGRNYEGSTGLASWAASTTVVECVPTAGLMSAAMGHPGDSTAAHAASAISNTPAVPLASTDVQAAINELAGLASGAYFAAGTRLMFQQTAAPTGWTKETNAAYNDAALRIITGTVATGGADAFSTLFGTGKSTAGYALTVNDMPSHNHGGATGNDSPDHTHGGGSAGSQNTPANGSASYPGAPGTQTQGASTRHTHAISAQGGGVAHSHTLNNFNLKYVDVIVCQKN